MATTNATGNQGSTGDQDPEPQQEILDTGAGIRRAARRGRRQPRQDAEGDQYGGYEDHQAQNAADNAVVRQAKERWKPAVEADLGGLFDFHHDDT